MKKAWLALGALLLTGCSPAIRQSGPTGSVARAIDGDVVVNGVRLHYLQWGKPTAPTMLVLTGTGGLGGVADQWQDFAERVAGDYRVVAPELRGTARSEWRGPYTWQQMVQDVDAFVDHFNLAPVLLIGHSGGAFWAVAYTSLHPSKVARLVAVEPSSDPWAATERAPVLQTFASRDEAFRYAKERWRTAASLDSLVRRVITLGTRNLPNGTVGWTIDTLGYGGWIPRGRDMQGLMERITVPTLLIRGQLSPWPHETAVRWAKAIPTANLVEVPDAGHVVQLANPDAFARTVCNFLQLTSCAPP